MSLQTLDIESLNGKVRFVTSRNNGYKVTVECYERNTAFLIHYSDEIPPVKVGDIVSVSGKVRFDPGIKSDGNPNDGNLGYYHEPEDGSPRQHWFFFELLDSSIKVLGPSETLDPMQRAMARMQQHIDSWSTNDGLASFQETLKAVDAARSALRKRVAEREEKNIPVATLDIDVD